MNSHYFPRKIDQKFNLYFSQRQIIVITGMRRVGKTTFIKHIFDQIKSKNKIYFDLEDILIRKIFEQENYQSIVSSLAKQGLALKKNKAYIFIDEIQYVPNIPSVIKYLYDKYNIKFIVTGSSSYYLKNRFTESLAGRKFVLELRPLTFKEFLTFKQIKRKVPNKWSEKTGYSTEVDETQMQSLYDEYFYYGGFPEVVLTKDSQIKRDILRDILNSYFQIDITTLAKFADTALLRDLLVLLTQRIGQKLNLTNLANVLKISRSRIYEYIELLKATYIIDTISQKSSIDNRISANSKLYFADTGLARILADIGKGSLFENSIYMNLIYDYDLTYYQTKSGREIDFVLDRKIGLEVKESASPTDLANLKKRSASAKISSYYLVSRYYNPIKNIIMAWDI